jgi:ribonuclease P protein component
VSPTRQRLSLGADRRIRCRRDFARVRQSGRRLAYGSLIANWMPLAAESRSRLGVITNRKVGNAVTRNRVRRLLRESFRRHQLDLFIPVDLVLVARPTLAGKSFAEVERVFLDTARKAGLLRKGC